MYTPEQIENFKETIIEQISKGKSLRAIKRKYKKKIPSRRYIYEWLNPEHENFDKIFSNHYARAKEDSADLDVEKMEDIVEEVRKGDLEPNQARVMADILKWTAGRKKPRKYGDKIDVTTDGEPIQQVSFLIPDNNRPVKDGN